MDSSDIRYILALTRREVLRNELEVMVEALSAMTSRLTKVQVSMRMLETDSPTLGYDSSSLLLSQALESLSRGKVCIVRSLSEYYGLRTSSAATTSGSSTTKSSTPADSAKGSTSG